MRPPVWLRLPLSAGARVASLYRLGEVMERRDSESGIDLRVRLAPGEVDRLRQDGVEVLANGVAAGPPAG